MLPPTRAGGIIPHTPTLKSTVARVTKKMFPVYCRRLKYFVEVARITGTSTYLLIKGRYTGFGVVNKTNFVLAKKASIRNEPLYLDTFPAYVCIKKLCLNRERGNRAGEDLEYFRRRRTFDNVAALQKI